MHLRLLGEALIFGVGVAYMVFGNVLVDPSYQAVAADKQDRVSRAILGTQVGILVLLRY